jgi:TetR/AcrR family transcriptional repressor of nem operon
MAGRPRNFDPEQVLDQVMLLFWQRGFTATGIAELEQATGLGRQSLYGAFGDKRALFDLVVERYFQRVIKPGLIDVLDGVGSERGARGDLELLLSAWESVASATDFNGCLLGNSVAELGLHDPELAEVLKRKLRLMEDAFYRNLKRAQKACELSAQLDARSVARSLVTTAQGLAVVARVNREPAFVRAVVDSARKLLA